MHIKFCGAATMVTGSCHLLTTEKHKILLDCGMFQGNKETEKLNYEDFGFDPAEIEYVVISHAHIDHSGRLPLLLKRGFRGRIYCTDATADLLDVMLKDSGYIQEKEAEWQNRKNLRAGRPPVEPLYTYNDALKVLDYLNPVMYDELVKIDEDLELVFNDAGHILGSAIVELFITENGEKSKLVFSGDLGVENRPILRDPTIIRKADFLIMETTYGNRAHEANEGSVQRLIDIVLDTIKRGGNVIIPSFAVGRTQEMIFEFNRFYEEHQEYREALDQVKVYVDSPMATTATEVFRKNAQVFDEETKQYILKGDNPLDFKNLEFVRTADESRALNFESAPKIIISASGMCEAGRIKHHLKHGLWNPKNSVVFVGYQAEGTLGRSIADGDKDVTIFGEKIHVEAEIHRLEGFSGHADRDGLLDWLGGFEKVPHSIFLVHGEMDGKRDFARSVKSRFGYDCIVVEKLGAEYEMVKDEDAVLESTDEDIQETRENLYKLRSKIATVHDQLESILYNTLLASGDDMTPERISEVNNIVLALEKSTLNLGSTVTKGDVPRPTDAAEYRQTADSEEGDAEKH
ncbi:MAG: MBL fold metallo-hydrolase [Bacillota bacterium]|nr:MBL fold metallo-hydrolase [Bacillota bacterium]